MYGWRASIGLVVPSSDRTSEMDFNALSPEGVAIYTSRVSLYETDDPVEKLDALRQMDAQIPAAARLLADARPDLILFSCTTGSFLEGPGTDERITQSIKSETGIDAITTTTALVEAIRRSGVKKIDLLTPYNVEIGRIAAAYFGEVVSGLEIENQHDLGIVSGLAKCKVTPAEIFEHSKRIASDSSDALVISCTALQCIPIIDALEKDLGKLVITSNLASLWLALDTLGIRESYAGRGQLLRSLSGDALAG